MSRYASPACTNNVHGLLLYPKKTGLLDLPPELRLKIFSYYPRCGCPYWRVVEDHPAVSLVSRQLRHESLDYFYHHYRWNICISISEDGNMAYMSSDIVKYLQALQQANQLYRIQWLRFQYAFPGVTFFSRTDADSRTHPFDVQDPDRVSFYDTLDDILCQVPKLRLIEFSRTGFDRRHVDRICSPACLRLLATLPKTCEYRLAPAPASRLPPRSQHQTESISSDPRIPSSLLFAEHLKEATGKTLLY